MRAIYLMNTSMTGFRWFSKFYAFLCLGCNHTLSLEALREILPHRMYVVCNIVPFESVSISESAAEDITIYLAVHCAATL